LLRSYVQWVLDDENEIPILSLLNAHTVYCSVLMTSL
jgi:hypothetical protein